MAPLGPPGPGLPSVVVVAGGELPEGIPPVPADSLPVGVLPAAVPALLPLHAVSAADDARTTASENERARELMNDCVTHCSLDVRLNRV
jgi:hypothetical protein